MRRLIFLAVLGYWLLAFVPPHARADGIVAAAAGPSFLFNAQDIDLDYMVNNGNTGQLSGTGAAAQWQPVAAAIPFEPLAPKRGALTWGSNTIMIRTSEGVTPYTAFVFEISASVGVLTQFQIYVVWTGGTDFRLMVLADGLFMTMVDPSNQ